MAKGFWATILASLLAIAPTAAGADQKFQVGPWEVIQKTNPMDDSQITTFVSDSLEPIYPPDAPRLPAFLILRCRGDKPDVIFTFGGYFMADIGQYGRVEYRIDDEKKEEEQTFQSIDNMSLMIGSEIDGLSDLYSEAFVMRLLHKSKLILRAIPFRNAPILVKFDVSRLKEAIDMAPTACGWHKAK